jgi:hypothetical protein
MKGSTWRSKGSTPSSKTPLESGRARIPVDGFDPANCREHLPTVSFDLEVGGVGFPI